MFCRLLAHPTVLCLATLLYAVFFADFGEKEHVFMPVSASPATFGVYNAESSHSLYRLDGGSTGKRQLSSSYPKQSVRSLE